MLPHKSNRVAVGAMVLSRLYNDLTLHTASHGHRRSICLASLKQRKQAREINVNPEISILALVSIPGTSRRLAWVSCSSTALSGWIRQCYQSTTQCREQGGLRAGRPSRQLSSCCIFHRTTDGGRTCRAWKAAIAQTCSSWPPGTRVRGRRGLFHVQ